MKIATLEKIHELLKAEAETRDMRINRSDFGYVSKIGKNAGRPYESYQQVWDGIVEEFKDSPIADKL